MDINEMPFPEKKDGDIVKYHEDDKWYRYDGDTEKWVETDPPETSKESSE